MLYRQNGCHGRHIIALGDLGEKRNTWRQNGTWIYANHHDPYIITVNCVLPYHWVYCNVDIDCIAFFGAPPQGDETL